MNDIWQRYEWATPQAEESMPEYKLVAMGSEAEAQSFVGLGQAPIDGTSRDECPAGRALLRVEGCDVFVRILVWQNAYRHYRDRVEFWPAQCRLVPMIDMRDEAAPVLIGFELSRSPVLAEMKLNLCPTCGHQRKDHPNG